MNTTTTAGENRTRLLRMIGGEDGIKKLYFYMAGYTLICTDVEDDTKPARFSFPVDDAAARFFMDAAGAVSQDDGAKHYCATFTYYGDDANDADIEAAMQQHPCFVNYGGTLCAHNTESAGELCFITKDMQA